MPEDPSQMTEEGKLPEQGLGVHAFTTLEFIKAKLNAPQSNYDEESAHVEADNVLCELLNALGYYDVVMAYESIDKWYA